MLEDARQRALSSAARYASSPVAVRQPDVEIAARLEERVVVLLVDREREDAGDRARRSSRCRCRGGRRSRRPRHARMRPVALKHADRDRDVVEQAEPFAVVGERVMQAAAEVDGAPASSAARGRGTCRRSSAGSHRRARGDQGSSSVAISSGVRVSSRGPCARYSAVWTSARSSHERAGSTGSRTAARCVGQSVAKQSVFRDRPDVRSDVQLIGGRPDEAGRLDVVDRESRPFTTCWQPLYSRW